MHNFSRIMDEPGTSNCSTLTPPPRVTDEDEEHRLNAETTVPYEGDVSKEKDEKVQVVVRKKEMRKECCNNKKVALSSPQNPPEEEEGRESLKLNTTSSSSSSSSLVSPFCGDDVASPRISREMPSSAGEEHEAPAPARAFCNMSVPMDDDVPQHDEATMPYPLKNVMRKSVSDPGPTAGSRPGGELMTTNAPATQIETKECEDESEPEEEMRENYIPEEGWVTGGEEDEYSSYYLHPHTHTNKNPYSYSRRGWKNTREREREDSCTTSGKREETIMHSGYLPPPLEIPHLNTASFPNGMEKENNDHAHPSYSPHYAREDTSACEHMTRTTNAHYNPSAPKAVTFAQFTSGGTTKHDENLAPHRLTYSSIACTQRRGSSWPRWTEIMDDGSSEERAGGEEEGIISACEEHLFDSECGFFEEHPFDCMHSLQGNPWSHRDTTSFCHDATSSHDATCDSASRDHDATSYDTTSFCHDAASSRDDKGMPGMGVEIKENEEEGMLILYDASSSGSRGIKQANGEGNMGITSKSNNNNNYYPHTKYPRFPSPAMNINNNEYNMNTVDAIHPPEWKAKMMCEGGYLCLSELIKTGPNHQEWKKTNEENYDEGFSGCWLRTSTHEDHDAAERRAHKNGGADRRNPFHDQGATHFTERNPFHGEEADEGIEYASPTCRWETYGKEKDKEKEKKVMPERRRRSSVRGENNDDWSYRHAEKKMGLHKGGPAPTHDPTHKCLHPIHQGVPHSHGKGEPEWLLSDYIAANPDEYSPCTPAAQAYRRSPKGTTTTTTTALIELAAGEKGEREHADESIRAVQILGRNKTNEHKYRGNKGSVFLAGYHHVDDDDYTPPRALPHKLARNSSPGCVPPTKLGGPWGKMGKSNDVCLSVSPPQNNIKGDINRMMPTLVKGMMPCQGRKEERTSFYGSHLGGNHPKFHEHQRVPQPPHPRALSNEHKNTFVVRGTPKPPAQNRRKKNENHHATDAIGDGSPADRGGELGTGEACRVSQQEEDINLQGSSIQKEVTRSVAENSGEKMQAVVRGNKTHVNNIKLGTGMPSTTTPSYTGHSPPHPHIPPALELQSYSRSTMIPHTDRTRKREKRRSNTRVQGCGLKKTGQLLHTTLCSFHARNGTCNKGNACPHAHSIEDLRPRPVLEKTKLCRNFTRGGCILGELCKYAHGQEDLNHTTTFYRTKMCRLKDKCMSMETCRYAHSAHELGSK